MRYMGGCTMYETFTQERIAQLRIKKGVSARDMSLTLGQNSSYINRIENRKALPSLQVLFWICEYFGITPREFFDEGSEDPAEIQNICEELKKLDGESLAVIKELVKKLNRI